MPDGVLFTYEGAGHEFPERLVATLRNGLLHLQVRGNPQVQIDHGASQEGAGRKLVAGGNADITIPGASVAALVQALMSVPPLQQAVGGYPFVLFFRREADREECIAALRAALPDIVDYHLDDAFPPVPSRQRNRRG